MKNLRYYLRSIKTYLFKRPLHSAPVCDSIIPQKINKN